MSRRKSKNIEEIDFINILSTGIKIPSLYKSIELHLGKYTHKELLFEELDSYDEIIVAILKTSELVYIYNIQCEGETIFKTNHYDYVYLSISRKDYNDLRYTISNIEVKK